MSFISILKSVLLLNPPSASSLVACQNPPPSSTSHALHSSLNFKSNHRLVSYIWIINTPYSVFVFSLLLTVRRAMSQITCRVNDRLTEPTNPNSHEKSNLDDPSCLRLRILDDSADEEEPWEYPRFCDFEAELDRHQVTTEKLTVEQLKQHSSEFSLHTKNKNHQGKKTIIVKLEQIPKGKNDWELPTAMILGMEQCFQVVFGKISSWTLEPPELIGLSLIRGVKAIKILPLRCPRDFEMETGDRIRIGASSSLTACSSS
ncbi:hypothetical protein PCANC_13541 [Puccinia coronata f. sp. avenae]|uniref:Uncharacterized protein n=2 Tax=Puccinia coronata f. sp. avenae TaxID=200324 RepID=A0A2N5UST1_9BASI|nr:hypothetical protein PCANC_13541 [Puccinia coronata f. sp. avenae]